jgi:hypothetical protein
MVFSDGLGLSSTMRQIHDNTGYLNPLWKESWTVASIFWFIVVRRWYIDNRKSTPNKRTRLIADWMTAEVVYLQVPSR